MATFNSGEGANDADALRTQPERSPQAASQNDTLLLQHPVYPHFNQGQRGLPVRNSPYPPLAQPSYFNHAPPPNPYLPQVPQALRSVYNSPTEMSYYAQEPAQGPVQGPGPPTHFTGHEHAMYSTALGFAPVDMSSSRRALPSMAMHRLQTCPVPLEEQHGTLQQQDTVPYQQPQMPNSRSTSLTYQQQQQQHQLPNAPSNVLVTQQQQQQQQQLQEQLQQQRQQRLQQMEQHQRHLQQLQQQQVQEPRRAWDMYRRAREHRQENPQYQGQQELQQNPQEGTQRPTPSQVAGYHEQGSLYGGRPMPPILGPAYGIPVSTDLSQRTSHRRNFDLFRADMLGLASEEDSSAVRERSERHQAWRRHMAAAYSMQPEARLQQLRGRMQRLTSDQLPAESDKSCSICRFDYSPVACKPTQGNEMAVRVPCKYSHVFGEWCIEEWFRIRVKHKERITCPVCREELTKINFEGIHWATHRESQLEDDDLARAMRFSEALHDSEWDGDEEEVDSHSADAANDANGSGTRANRDHR